MRYAPWLLLCLAVVILMAGPGARKTWTGERMLITLGGLFVAAVLFAWILFRGS